MSPCSNALHPKGWAMRMRAVKDIFAYSRHITTEDRKSIITYVWDGIDQKKSKNERPNSVYGHIHTVQLLLAISVEDVDR